MLIWSIADEKKGTHTNMYFERWEDARLLLPKRKVFLRVPTGKVVVDVPIEIETLDALSPDHLVGVAVESTTGASLDNDESSVFVSVNFNPRNVLSVQPPGCVCGSRRLDTCACIWPKEK